jgi:hypothetical protein
LTQTPALRPPTVANWPRPAPVSSPEISARSRVRLASLQQTPPTPHTLSPSSLLQVNPQNPGDVPLEIQRLLAQPLAIVVDGVQSA